MVRNGKEMDRMCPVCGFEMDEPPAHYNICPSCGTEFGVNDVNVGIARLRQNWISRGMLWWSKTDPRPENWSPVIQLGQRINRDLTASSYGSVKFEKSAEYAYTLPASVCT